MLAQDKLQTFRNRLERRFLELRERIRQELLQSGDQTHVEIAGQVGDLENSSLADLLIDVALADIDRHVTEIRDIDAALLRIAEGSYGICSDCGEAIEEKRLEVYPTAKRCRPCQAKHEDRPEAPRHVSL